MRADTATATVDDQSASFHAPATKEVIWLRAARKRAWIGVSAGSRESVQVYV